jgi:4-aminobutyrate aminotransferase-like enzyme
MVAGLATLEAVEKEKHLEDGREIGAPFTPRLRELQDKREPPGDIRGPGWMIGIEVMRSRESREPAGEETSGCIDEGVYRIDLLGPSRYAGMGDVVKIKPSRVISESEAECVMEVLEEVTRVVGASSGTLTS